MSVRVVAAHILVGGKRDVVRPVTADPGIGDLALAAHGARFAYRYASYLVARPKPFTIALKQP